jgi:cytoskeleton protein RodZ
MEHLGAQFKDAREAQGLSLQAIADKTKISVTVLEAVERNDFSRLPGGIFGRSFIRAYAIELGLDADSAVAGFVEKLEESEREAAARGAVRPEITPDDRRFLERQRRALFWLRVGMVAVVVGLVVLVGLAWGMRERLHFSSSPVTTNAPATK